MVKTLQKAAHKLHYKTEFQGLPISIENKKGSYRYWHDSHTGKDGKSKMYCAYGYIRLTKGADGDHVDVYLGPDKESRKVFVVHQNVPETGHYDEDKVFLGWTSAKEAKKAYMKQYDDPKFFGFMDEFDIDTFKDKVHRKKGKIIKAVRHMLVLKKASDSAQTPSMKVNVKFREEDDANAIARARIIMNDKERYAGAKRGAKRILKEKQKDVEDMEEQTEELEALSLEKAKKMAVGTISHGRKKVAEGKWVDVPKGKGHSLEQKVSQAKALGKKAFLAGKKLIPAQDPALMKLTEGLPVGGGAKEIMEAWSKEWQKANLAAPVSDLTPSPPNVPKGKLDQHRLIDPATMTPAQVNKELAALDKKLYVVTDASIKAGFGDLTPSAKDQLISEEKADPKLVGFRSQEKKLLARKYQLVAEVEARMGPGYYEMKPGFKRRKSLEDIEPGLKLYNVELLKPSEFKKAIRGDSMMVFGKARGKKATVGTRAVHGGKKMVKTADGWRPVKGEGLKAPSSEVSATNDAVAYLRKKKVTPKIVGEYRSDSVQALSKKYREPMREAGIDVANVNWVALFESLRINGGGKKKSNERGTPDQDTKGPKGRGAGPGGGKADGSGLKGAKDEARTSGIVMNWLIARKVGNVKQAKALKVAAKKAGGFKTDAALNTYLMKYGDPDASGQYSVVMDKWDAHFSAAAKVKKSFNGE